MDWLLISLNIHGLVLTVVDGVAVGVGPANVGTRGSFVNVIIVVLLRNINIFIIPTIHFTQSIDRSFAESELVVDEFSRY